MTNTLPENWGQLWVDGLRSGRYRQCQGNFFGEGMHACAIGVLAMELVRFGSITDRRVATRRVTDVDPILANTVVTMNDWVGRSFGEIADHLEAHFGLAPSVRVLVGETIAPLTTAELSRSADGAEKHLVPA